ncbi:TonB-dependent receptor [Termitidicoccus mucosus]
MTNPSIPRFIPRFASLAASLLLLDLPPLAAAPASTQDEEATVLDKVLIEDVDVEKSVLPIRPNNAFYGFDELIKDTPRSIFQVTKAQIDNDHFHNFSDLARYSPSIGRGTASNFSTFAKIRGGPADTTRNGILLLNPAVRPFDNNAWESVDIVAGVPSVIQGSTTRTAGVINYVTKRPLFDGEHLQLSTTLGRIGLDDRTTYGQYTVQADYNRVLLKDKLAARVSLQKTDATQYWGNSESDFEDVYVATTWQPTSKVTVDTNFTYTSSRGAMPYGINRVTQNLIDNWLYDAGPIAPVVSWDHDGNPATAAIVYRGSATTGAFTPVATTAVPTPPAAAFTQENPAVITGWWRNPDEQPSEDVPIDGSQTLHTNDAFSDTYEVIGQNIVNVRFNENYSFRNNTLYQYSKSYVFGYDGYHSFMVNKMFTTRLEFLTDHTFNLGSGTLRHQSNSGFEYRYLWNLCDNAGNSERTVNDEDASDRSTGGGHLGAGNLLGIDNIYAQGDNGVGSPADYYYRSDIPYFAINSPTYGWLAIAPAYHRGGGRYAQLSLRAASGTDVRLNRLQQYNFFTEQKFQWEKFIWRFGARVTAIRDKLRALEPTYEAVAAGVLTGYNFDDKVAETNYDLNSSLTWQPKKWLSLYGAFDHDIAAGDCGCCLTQGFMASNPNDAKDQGLNRDHFKLKSQLVEFGTKFEIIPGKLFASAAWFHQTRHTPISVTVTTPYGGMTKQTFEGVELAASYQPTNSLATGVNFSHIAVTENDGSWARAIPRNSGNVWAAYTFSNGLGLKASAWITSEWKVSNTAYVPTQYNVDAGVFYSLKGWRFDVDVLNLTDEKNWAPSGNYAGDTVGYLLPAERFGVQFKATYRF